MRVSRGGVLCKKTRCLERNRNSLKNKYVIKLPNHSEPLRLAAMSRKSFDIVFSLVPRASDGKYIWITSLERPFEREESSIFNMSRRGARWAGKGDIYMYLW
jgi:hypothetical protein